MFSPVGSPPGPSIPRNTNSAGRRPIGSPGTTKAATPSRVVRTPHNAQLVQLESSAGEFARRAPSSDDLDESLSEEIIDETEAARSRRASRFAQEAGSSSAPPSRQVTSVGPPPGSTAASSRCSTPSTPVQLAGGVPSRPGHPAPAPAGTASTGPAPASSMLLAADATIGGGGGTTPSSGKSTPKPKPRPPTLSSAAVESPASPDFGEDEPDERRPAAAAAAASSAPPRTTAAAAHRANGGHVAILAETPAAQRAAAEARLQRHDAGEPPTTPPQITLGNKHLVGAGAFGSVYRALDLATNRTIAVKEIRLMHVENAALAKKEMEKLEREIRVMQKLSHPNIVKYLGSTRGDGVFNILMEFVTCGSVASLIKTFGPLQPIQAALFTKQILAGLEYLHSKRIAHRDLKGDNLFVDVDGSLKLGDFGMAKELQTLKSHGGDSLAGTPYFMAPEVVKNGAQGLESDIWSLGCCVIQMLAGEPPFKKFDNQMAILFQVSRGQIAPQIPAGIPDDVRDFILTCCRLDPKARPTVSELLQHPWLLAAPPVPTMTRLSPAVEPAPAPAASSSSMPPLAPPATRAHSRGTPDDQPTRPTGSGKSRPVAGSSPTPPVAASRSPTPNSRPPSASKDKTTTGGSSRGVAAARQLRKQTERPTGSSGARRAGAAQQ